MRRCYPYEAGYPSYAKCSTAEVGDAGTRGGASAHQSSAPLPSVAPDGLSSIIATRSRLSEERTRYSADNGIAWPGRDFVMANMGYQAGCGLDMWYSFLHSSRG